MFSETHTTEWVLHTETMFFHNDLYDEMMCAVGYAVFGRSLRQEGTAKIVRWCREA